jgi:hypothetical protein
MTSQSKDIHLKSQRASTLSSAWRTVPDAELLVENTAHLAITGHAYSRIVTQAFAIHAMIKHCKVQLLGIVGFASQRKTHAE